jgi:multiple sugar transport system permease protein
METKNNIKGWLYLAPSLVLLAVFTFYPLFSTFVIAFVEKYNYMDPVIKLFGEERNIGFGNFVQIFKPHSLFVGSFTNTLIIVFVSVPLSTALALVISVALNSIKPLQKVFQTVFFLPYVTNAIAIGMVFAVMFNSDFGIVNGMLKSIGLNTVNWLGPKSQFTRMVVLLTYIIWSALPFKILILLSGLQGIDKQYYQAAQIDSASKFKVFWRITVPMLSPQVAYLMITSFIGAFKEYTSIVAIFPDHAGPIGAPYTMTTVVWYIYDRMKVDVVEKGMGYAAAAAMVLFVVIMLFTALNLYISKKKVYY